MGKSYMITIAGGREFAVIDGAVYAGGNEAYMSRATETALNEAIRAKFEIPDCLNLWTRPDSYMGAEWYGFISVVSRTRDSGCLEISNFETAREMLGDAATVVSESHWACGWVEWIAVECRNAGGVAIAADIVAALSDYPVLNDEHFSALEWETAQDNWASDSIRDRAELCKRAGVSIFAARRETIPQEDNGFIFERCLGY